MVRPMQEFKAYHGTCHKSPGMIHSHPQGTCKPLDPNKSRLLLSCHRPPIGPCQPCLTKGGRTRTRSLLIQPLAPLAACEGKVGQHVGQKLLCKSLAAGTSMLIMVVFCGF